MKFDVIHLEENDVVLTTLDIGNMPPEKVDEYSEAVLSKLKDMFQVEVAVLPIRGGSWDFTIIKRPIKK